MKAKFYVGTKLDGIYETFKSQNEPTQESHGKQYLAVIGPFITKRGADFMAKHGKGNPHLQHVDDAERIAKQYA